MPAIAISTIREFIALRKVFEVSVMTFFVLIAIAIFEFVLPLYGQAFVGSVSILALALVMDNIVSLFLDAPVGIAVDKYGRKRILLIGLAGLAIIVFAYAFATSIYQLIVLAMIYGIFSVAFWIPSAVLVRDYSPQKLLTEAQGVFLAFSRFGRMAGPVLAGIIAAVFWLGFNFITVSLMLGASLVYGYFILKDKKITLRQEKTKTLQLFREYYKMHIHAPPLYALSFFVYFWVGIEWIYVQLAAANVFGLHIEYIGALFASMIGTEALLYFPSGYLMDRIGRRYIIISGFLLLFASTYFAFLSVTVERFAFFAILSAGAIGWILPGTEAILTEIVAERKRGEMTGVLDTARNLGMVIGPLSAGVLADITFNLMAPFLLVAVIAGFGTVTSLVFWRR